jgi:hypothetical protein
MADWIQKSSYFVADMSFKRSLNKRVGYLDRPSHACHWGDNKSERHQPHMH